MRQRIRSVNQPLPPFHSKEFNLKLIFQEKLKAEAEGLPWTPPSPSQLKITAPSPQRTTPTRLENKWHGQGHFSLVFFSSFFLLLKNVVHLRGRNG